MAFKRVRPSIAEAQTNPNGARPPSVRDLVEMLTLPNATWVAVRVLPGHVSHPVHEYPLYRKDGTPVINEKFKERDGSPRQTCIPKVCLQWDDDLAHANPNKPCPYCEAGMDSRMEHYLEVIDRGEQESEPTKHRPSSTEAKTGIKDKENSGSWTPCRVLKVSNSLLEKIQSLTQLNFVGKGADRQKYPVDDQEYGCDIMINFDRSRPGADMYQVQKGDRTPLTEDELEYLRWDIEAAVSKAMESDAEATRNVEYLNRTRSPKGGDEKKKEPKAKTAKAEAVPENDTLELDAGVVYKVLTSDDESFTGEVVSVTASKVTFDVDGDTVVVRRSMIERAKPVAATKSKAKPVPVDDDDDYAPPPRKAKHVPVDDEDDAPPRKAKPVPVDDDEDDVPPPRKAKPRQPVPVDDEDDEPPVVKSKRPAYGEDEDDVPPPRKAKTPAIQEDEGEEPPRKSKAKPTPAYDEEEEDVPPPRKAKPRLPAPVDDEDEDDEPPPRKAKRHAHDEDEEDYAPPPRKAKPVPVDDDEDDVPPVSRPRAKTRFNFDD